MSAIITAGVGPAKRVGDCHPFRCGDIVFDKADPRHLGRVDSINNGATANVTWIETGWQSQVRLTALQKEPNR